MKRPGLGIAGFAALAFLAALVSGSALAYFTATGTGNASAGVSQLTTPSLTATPAVGGTVALSWSAVTPPGPGTVTYTVTRDNGEADGTCDSTLTVVTCTDSGLSVGTYNYVVTAKWRSWTTVSGTKNAKVTIGAADRLILTAASASPAAAASDNLTLTAKDAAGNTVTSYTGAKNITFSGAPASPNSTKPTVANSSGTAVNFGTATPLSFTNGVASPTSSTKNGVMKLYASGAAGIEATDGTISTLEPLSVTVTPLSATKLVLGAATTTPTAGAIDNLTTTAQDTYGNTATSYAGSKSLTYTGASASPGGNTPTVSDAGGNSIAFGTATPTTFNAGVASVSGEANGAMRLYKSGAATVKVSDGTFSATLATTTAAASAAKFLLAAATTTPVAAAADNLTITAQDAYTNTATSYIGAHNLTFSGSSASPSGTLPSVVDSGGATVNFGSATALNFTLGIASVASSKNGVMKLNRVGAATIGVSDGTISNPTPLAVTVSPGAASRWGIANIVISAGTLGPNCLFTCTLTGLGNSGTVTAKVVVTDSVGNTVSSVGTGHAAKVTLTGSGTLSGTPLTIPSTGAAETATTFTFTSKSAGNFSETLTVAASTGTAYTTATLTASK